MAEKVVLATSVQPLYDTSFIPLAGVQLMQFFSQSVGQGASNWGPGAKTLADTNISGQSGTIPRSYGQIVTGFRLMPSFNMTIVDATLAFNGAVFVFSIPPVDWLTVPVRTIPAGMGMYAGGGTANGALASHGFPDIHNSFGIKSQMIEIGELQSYSAKCLWPAGGQAVTTNYAVGPTVAGAAGLPITCFLDGWQKRLTA